MEHLPVRMFLESIEDKMAHFSSRANVYRYGAGTRGTLSTLSMYMLNSAATFSFFLSIGSVRFPTYTGSGRH